MDMNINIRPKGKMYIFGLVLIYIFLSGILAFSILFILEKIYWALLLEILPIVLIFLQTREVILYKIRLTDTKIYLAANRQLFMIRHNNLKISYKGLKSIQYFLGFETIGLISAIALVYENDKLKYLDVLRFSDKQVDIIMGHIKDLAEKYNSYPIEIKPDEIQKGFKRKH